MAIHYLPRTALIMLLTNLAIAQTARKSTIIPSDLQEGFLPGDAVQVSYTNNAVNGFRDGTLFSKDAVSDEPTFALGDSSGISPLPLYTMIMVDTTCPNSRTLHYARPNFKYNFDITNINTSSPALLDYIAPGSLDETGDNRQYSFLMYRNPGREEITKLKLPAKGEKFDVGQFQDDNGLGDPTAGVGMVVNLGGKADCGGESAESLPATLPTPIPATSTRAVSVAPTGNTDGNGDTSLPSLTASAGDSNKFNSSVASTSSARTDLTVTSFVFPSSTPSPSPIISTIILSIVGAGASPTESAGLPEPTTNAAPGLSNRCSTGIALLLVAAGVLIW